MKKINRNIIGKLIDKFKLEQGMGSDKLYLNETISPVFEVDSILFDTKGDTKTGTAASRTDVYTVPTNKYWILKNLGVGRGNAGGVSFQLVINGVSYIIEDVNSATRQYTTGLNIKINPGDAVKIVCGSGTSGAITSYIVYQEYEVK